MLQEQRTITKEESEIRESIVSSLRELALTSYAARAFVALIENSPVSASLLCKLTGIPDSKIYYALDELVRRKLIMVQRGTPSLYRAHDMKRIIANLEESTNQDLARRLNMVRNLGRRLAPLASRRHDAQVELAYIVKGIRNITEKMRSMVSEARSEIVLLSSNEEILRTALAAFRQSSLRGIKLKVAAIADLHELRDLRNVHDLRALECDCNVLIVDGEKLLTISHPESEDCYAIITEDPTMIRFSREWFENPKCAKPCK